MRPVVDFLEHIGVPKGCIRNVLFYDVEKDIKPTKQVFTKVCGEDAEFGKMLLKYPWILSTSIQRKIIRKSLLSFMQIRLDYRRGKLHLMVGRFSPLLGNSIEEVLRPKYEFLANAMQKPLEEVVEYPRYFSYSLEKKIKPRFWVIKGRNCECNLKDMLGADYMSV
ncbi:putative transcription regulator mTERF family [Helianthus annuus]|nr:putative transcription regulator mTERF family [Helianthus annuus]